MIGLDSWDLPLSNGIFKIICWSIQNWALTVFLIQPKRHPIRLHSNKAKRIKDICCFPCLLAIKACLPNWLMFHPKNGPIRFNPKQVHYYLSVTLTFWHKPINFVILCFILGECPCSWNSENISFQNTNGKKSTWPCFLCCQGTN